MKIISKYVQILGLFFFIAIVALSNMNPAAMAASDPATTNQKLAPPSPFSDVTSSDPNRIFITYVSQRGIIKGFPDGTYHPQAGLTRAQAAVVICKAAGLATPAADTGSFRDVPVGHWAASYINAASKAGYLKGFPGGAFQPEAKLTRAQGVSLIMRLCTQKQQAPLPVLNDLTPNHWAASSIGTALALEMIGLSNDGKNVYPDAEMSRGSLSRALALLLTKDPGLNQVNLEGKLSEIKGHVSLVRQGQSFDANTVSQVLEGDQIITAANSSVRIDYPDGSSNLLEADSEVIVKQSDGRRYIKQDGSPGIAVDYVNLELKMGTIFDTVAAKHETGTQQSTAASRADRLLAASGKFHYLAAGNETPWYKTAETKKVKVKVDMPWGVAAIRGTFIKVTVNPDGTCQVACLTGSAEVSGSSGGSVPLGGGQSSGINNQGSPAGQAGPMSSADKQGFDHVQAWVVNSALQQDVNEAAAVQPVVVMVSIPDGQPGEQQVQEAQPGQPTDQAAENAQAAETAVQAVLDALQASGIQLSPEVISDLTQEMEQVLGLVDQTTAQQLQDQADQSPSNNGNGGGNSQTEAAAPSSVLLSAGSTNPVGGVTNVTIPTARATDTTGAVTGWISSTANTIKFTVTDTSPATSTITINGAAYTSGNDYSISAASTLTIVVTTSQTGTTTAVRTFLITVTEAPAAAPSCVLLSAGSINPVGGVTNVAIPIAGATDTTGAVTGWISSTANTIKFTVTDTSPAASTITINGTAYTSGNNYAITSATPLSIVVTTSQTGRTTEVRTFTISVSAAADISGSFTDPLFKQAVWEWLGHTGTPGSFTKQELTNRMAANSYILGLTNNPSVTSLAGLENFEGTGLTRLNCYWDPLLTSLPALPSSLTELWCDYSGLTSLPALPSGLTKLYANNNQLTSLPTLPTGLIGSCDGNYLNIWATPLLTNLSTCPSVNKTPQYSYSYTGTAITLSSAGTRQLAVAELPRQQSLDGSSWGTPVTVSLSDFIFSTSDAAVATVSGAGLITAIGPGTCDINAKYRNIDAPFTKVTIPVTVTYGAVIYDGNGNDGGTVPANASYASGGSTTVASVGDMIKTDCTFIGWNTAADWTGTDYAPDATINTAGNTTLYVKWQLNISPDVSNLGFSYYNAYLDVKTSALPAYTRLEIFIKAGDPGESTAGSNESQYSLDLTVPTNLTLGWHNVGSSLGIDTAYNMWYRYVYGTAKSAWVADGHPLGMMPVKGGSNDYDFVGVDATNITLLNTSGTCTGGKLYVVRGGIYISLGAISGANQGFTVQPNDCIVIQSVEGNYSYESAPYVY